MATELKYLEEFTECLLRQGRRKAELYDGAISAGRGNEGMDINFAIALAAEELGEIASAITRERYVLALAECIDLAHCAFLIALSIKSQRVDADE